MFSKQPVPYVRHILLALILSGLWVQALVAKDAIEALGKALDTVQVEQKFIERNAAASMKNGYRRAIIGIESEKQNTESGFDNTLSRPQQELRVCIGRDLSSGELSQTGSQTHIALSGKGFFKFKDASGAYVYSRDGALQKNKNNQLENILHQTLLSADGGPIAVNPEVSELFINQRGEVFQKGQLIARIGVFHAPGLSKQLQDNKGGFTLTPAAETYMNPLLPEEVSVIQGSLESANGSMLEDSSQLMRLQSWHQVLTKSISEAGRLQESITQTLYGQ